MMYSSTLSSCAVGNMSGHKLSACKQIFNHQCVDAGSEDGPWTLGHERRGYSDRPIGHHCDPCR
jgi:hypothetical protein